MVCWTKESRMASKKWLMCLFVGITTVTVYTMR